MAAQGPPAIVPPQVQGGPPVLMMPPAQPPQQAVLPAQPPPQPQALVDIPGDENNLIADLLGSPIHRFDISQDPKCVPLYNAFKPVILKFFYACNHPEQPENENYLKTIMDEMRARYPNRFFMNANSIGLCPNVLDPNPENNWKNEWFEDLFQGDEDSRLSLVIQGGEAVNYYSFYKYNSVPTHDADTRVLAGDHFHYLREIAAVDPNVKRLMHKYRFFVAFALCAALSSFLRELQLTNSDYLTQFIPNWPTNGVDRIRDVNRCVYAMFGRQNLMLKILRINASQTFINHWPDITPYDINDDFILSRLIDIEANIVFVGTPDEPPPQQGNYHCALVDLFIPHRVTSTDIHDYNRIGQSDRIHQYFSTDQAGTTMPNPPGSPPNEPGRIPSHEFDLTIPASIPLIGPAEIQLRIIPHGFILFETLRMLFVSDAFSRHFRPNKLLKYKQKLCVLLSTLMNYDLSNFIYETCQNFKDQNPAGPDISAYLVGGRRKIEMDMAMNSINMPNYMTLKSREMKGYNIPSLNMNSPPLNVNSPPLNVNSPPLNVNSPPLNVNSSDTLIHIERAKAISKEFQRRENKGEKVTAEGLTTEDEWLGYMDFLSYQNPDFKDLRLPSSEYDTMNDDTTIESEYENLMNENNNKKGGYRRQTPKKRKAKRYTRRK